MRAILTDPLYAALLGGLMSAGASWLFTWIYYKRAGDTLRDEAAALHRATSAIVYFLQHPDAQIEVQQDDAGRVTGLLVSAAGVSTSKSTVRVEATDATPAGISSGSERKVPDRR